MYCTCTWRASRANAGGKLVVLPITFKVRGLTGFKLRRGGGLRDRVRAAKTARNAVV